MQWRCVNQENPESPQALYVVVLDMWWWSIRGGARYMVVLDTTKYPGLILAQPRIYSVTTPISVPMDQLFAEYSKNTRTPCRVVDKKSVPSA